MKKKYKRKSPQLRPSTETFEQLEHLPLYAFGDTINELLFLENVGFADWTVGDILDFLMEYIEWKRKKKEEKRR